MFSIRVHQPNVPGHRMHECTGYEVKPRPGGAQIVMELRDGTKKTIDILAGGKAYVMGDSGKTVEVVPNEPRTAVMRGAR